MKKDHLQGIDQETERKRKENTVVITAAVVVTAKGKNVRKNWE